MNNEFIIGEILIPKEHTSKSTNKPFVIKGKRSCLEITEFFIWSELDSGKWYEEYAIECSFYT